MSTSPPAYARLHRLTALLGIALVLALNVLAVWPEGHAWLHVAEKTTSCPSGHTHHSAPSHDEDEHDDCIIVTFAAGDAGAAVWPDFIFARMPVRVATLACDAAFAAAAPAFFLPPGCGPPVA